MSEQQPARRPIRMVLADDHPVVLRGMAALLEADGRFEVVARCGDGTACLEKIRALMPDLALVDLAMPGMTGLGVLEAVERERLPVRVAILTAARTPVDVARAYRAGVWGILLKDAAPEEMVRTLVEIAAGRRAVPMALVEETFAAESGDRARNEHDGDLTAREREVMHLVGQGLSNRAIGARRTLTEGTVKNHLHSIYEKLGVRNRTELALLARGRT
jgi:two-component system, NarL family, nitrate/nitrite response regulator NarL